MQKLQVYMFGGNWVFDEPDVCEREPFVMGSTNIITRVARDNGIKNVKKRKLDITFDSKPFENSQCHMKWTHGEANGNWYYSEEKGMKGWLCPMLLYYFKTAPKDIYFRVDDAGEAPKILSPVREKFSIADFALEHEDGTVETWDDLEDHLKDDYKNPWNEEDYEEEEKEYNPFAEYEEVQAFLEDEIHTF